MQDDTDGSAAGGDDARGAAGGADAPDKEPVSKGRRGAADGVRHDGRRG